MRVRLAVLFACVGVSTLSWAEDDSPRRERNVAVALVSSALLEDPVPFSGVQVAWSVTDRIALDLSAETLGHFTLMVVGLRAYAFAGPICPYAFARGGISLQTFNSEAPPWILPGIGGEYVARSGVGLFAEAGPAITVRPNGESRIYAAITAGLEYRFGLRSLPPVRRFTPVAPGKLNEACGETSSGVYVCEGGLVCREMRCVPEAR